MLHTISIIAQKGGSGKTALALTLAVAVEQASRIAVVLDIDSQATACKWSARRAAETPLVLAVQPARLPGALTTTAAHDVDVVVIDTPARSEHAALEAARVAELVVIPCRPQLYDLETVPETLQVLSLAGGVSAVVVLSGVAARGPRTDQAQSRPERTHPPGDGNTYSEPIECSPPSTSISRARADKGTRHSRVCSIRSTATLHSLYSRSMSARRRGVPLTCL